MPNNRINTDWQFRCAPLPAGYAAALAPWTHSTFVNREVIHE